MYTFNPERQVTSTLTDLHPSIRPTSYMEVHQLLGTSGCSNDAAMWDWSVLGVIENPRGKVVVFPGDVIRVITPGVYYPNPTVDVVDIEVEPTLIDSELISQLVKACEAVHRVTELYPDIPEIQKTNILKQIDLFHIPDEWEVGHDPVDIESYKLLLDWLTLAKPLKGPGLGLAANGNVLAVWMFYNDRLVLEFSKNSDVVKWTINRNENDVDERLSGSSTIKKVYPVIKSFVGDQFFKQT